MELLALLDWLVVVLVVNTVLGVGTLLRNPKAVLNWLFVGFVGFLNSWIVSNFLENEPGLVGENNLELFLRIDFATALVFFFFWFWFSAVIAKSRLASKRYRWLQLLSLGLTLLGVVLSFTPLTIHSVVFEGTVIRFEDGVLWPLYAIPVLLFPIWGVSLLFLRRRRAKLQGDNLTSRQLGIIIIGFVISMANGLIINLGLQTFVGVSLEVSRLGLYGMTILVALTAFAIARQRLFDFRLILARAIGFLMLLGVVGLALAAILLTGATRIAGVEVTFVQYLFGLVLIMVAMFLYQPLQGMVRALTNRVFFKGSYDSEELVFTLTRIMAGTIDLERMTRQLLETLTEQMRISRAAFLLVDGHMITDVRQIGYDQKKLESSALERLLHTGEGEPQIMVYEEIADPARKEQFRALDITIAVPVLIEKREVAVLLLGPKLSGEIYRRQDLNVIDIFSREVGIAVHNAKSYYALQQLTRRLEQRVEERTRELKLAQRRELEKAEAVAELKDEFVFIAAHELRTPVTAIRGFLELVGQSETDFPPPVRSHLSRIEAASSHLNQLVNDLLEISRSEAGELHVSAAEISMKEAAEEAVREIASLAKAKKLSIKVDMEGKNMVKADAQRVKEILLNLLSNAVKYNRKNGEVVVRVRSNDKSVRVDVEDTGYGIPRDQQAKIFQKFFRASSEATRDVQGTGLGLFIVRMLLSKMDGTITFTSEEGKGSVFTFTLPIAKKKRAG